MEWDRAHSDRESSQTPLDPLSMKSVSSHSYNAYILRYRFERLEPAVWNWLFSASVSGATASADLYSLIVTAKQNGLNTYDYLKKVLTEMPKLKANDIDQLMPYQKLD